MASIGTNGDTSVRPVAGPTAGFDRRLLQALAGGWREGEGGGVPYHASVAVRATSACVLHPVAGRERAYIRRRGYLRRPQPGSAPKLSLRSRVAFQSCGLECENGLVFEEWGGISKYAST